MCEWGIWKEVRVKIPARLSATGEECWRLKAIDVCLSDLVIVLQQGGIDMKHSCCSHGLGFGHIALQDGRMLVITDEGFIRGTFSWGLRAVLYGIRMNAHSFVHHLKWYLRRSQG